MTQGDYIRKARIDAGLTQDELAEKLKTTKQTICKYENDIVTNIPANRIKEMSEILGISPMELLGWKTKPDDMATDDDLEMLHKNPDLRILLSASQKLRKSDIEFLVGMAHRMNGDEWDE